MCHWLSWHSVCIVADCVQLSQRLVRAVNDYTFTDPALSTTKQTQILLKFPRYRGSSTNSSKFQPPPPPHCTNKGQVAEQSLKKFTKNNCALIAECPIFSLNNHSTLLTMHYPTNVKITYTRFFFSMLVDRVHCFLASTSSINIVICRTCHGTIFSFATTPTRQHVRASVTTNKTSMSKWSSHNK